jgi:hypothetical protein
VLAAFRRTGWGREWRYFPAKIADWLDEREVGLNN